MGIPSSAWEHHRDQTGPLQNTHSAYSSVIFFPVPFLHFLWRNAHSNSLVGEKTPSAVNWGWQSGHELGALSLGTSISFREWNEHLTLSIMGRTLR